MSSLLRVSTAGHVDDGKSTLIGRLLVETGNVPIDVADSIKKSSKDFDGGFDFSLVTDGLSSEQEQKITIDVAYRYFSTEKRHYILADTPGHVQYTRNMVTGASTADVAVVLIDASRGIASQSRRHSIISSLLGIHHLIVAVNKMDLVGYDQNVFKAIRAEFTKFASRLDVKDVRFLPVSALKGDNVTSRSARMPWYAGETLQETLDSLYVEGDRNRIDFRLPIQRVIQKSGAPRHYAGQIASGVVRVGDALAVLPSGFEVRVTGIHTPHGAAVEAGCEESISLTLDREVDISRGDLLAPTGNLPKTEAEFDSTLIWFDEEPLHADRIYWLKQGTRWTKARVEAIRYKMNVENLRKVQATGLELNDIARVAIRAFRPLVFDAYTKNRATGNFILVDPVTGKTAAAGMILDRRSNAGKTAKAIDTESVAITDAKTVLFTGLSASGKEKIAEGVAQALKRAGLPAKWLDAEGLRRNINRDLGYSTEDRHENLRRMAEVAKMFNEEGVKILASFTAPYENDRAMVREIIGQGAYLEVFVESSETTPRGLKSPYEIPAKPDLTLNLTRQTLAECVDQVLSLLARKQN